MCKADLYSSFFWLIFSLYALIHSYFLKLTSWEGPGPGYFPFGASLLFVVMSMVVFIKSLRRKPRNDEVIFEKESGWRNVPLVLLAMLLFSILFNHLGFTICTFLLYLFFLRMIAMKSWVKAVTVSLSITVVSYFLFNVLLKAHLPKGIFY